ncbi:hypothetical protein HYFRA_00008980 [Hymenoscyphus fraxineus]|uniref:Uncharacterized protein n=1 Tax=Hymenoscyphus fraxineus TaxID=746836 RepID=A0A9N9KSH6_9HELO|nr:hypothetical protein HYFRA_00008980 [Hymenoscyphus fraxineus]
MRVKRRASLQINSSPTTSSVQSSNSPVFNHDCFSANSCGCPSQGQRWDDVNHSAHTSLAGRSNGFVTLELSQSTLTNQPYGFIAIFSPLTVISPNSVAGIRGFKVVLLHTRTGANDSSLGLTRTHASPPPAHRMAADGFLWFLCSLTGFNPWDR